MLASSLEKIGSVSEKNMNYLIEEQQQLEDLEPLFRQLSEQSGVIAVDTEFLREKTYSAKLCLVQLGIDEHQYCIDVLAIDDLSLLIGLFADENILKLFHAARQDMEVVYQTLNVLPKPIFDTQLASAFCGGDMQQGYGAMVLERTGVELPKTQSRTDWTRRPLSADQIEYAGDDVAHLEELYRQTQQLLEDNQRVEWYQQEIESYYELDKYIIDPALAYKRLSGGSLNIRQQHALRAMAEWRERTAQKRDIPRSWVMRDDKLYDLVTQQPKTEQEIRDMDVFGRKSVVYLAPLALEIMSNLEVSEERLWHKVDPLTKQQKVVCSGLMKELRNISNSLGVAQGLLGTRKNIEHLFRHRSSKRLLQGWRKEHVGEALLARLDELEV
ncbi:MAG: ribonuclease D [Arenicella sp.]|jgi:ribonuclease D